MNKINCKALARASSVNFSKLKELGWDYEFIYEALQEAVAFLREVKLDVSSPLILPALEFVEMADCFVVNPKNEMACRLDALANRFSEIYRKNNPDGR